MVDRTLVVRVWLFEHVVEQAATASRGASRSFAVRGSDEGLVGVFRLPRSTLVWWGRLLPFLPLLLFLGGGVGLGVAALCGRIFLALVRLVVENGTNGLFASS